MSNNSLDLRNMARGADVERATLSLCERINNEITRKMIGAGATGEQILIALEAHLASAPEQPPLQQRAPALIEPQNPFSAFAAFGAQPASGFGSQFDAEYAAGELVAKSLKARGYGPTVAGMRDIA